MKVTTKVTKDSPEVTTDVTINWDDVTEGDLKAWALQSILIKCQSAWRRSGNIPVKAEVRAADWKIGTRHERGQSKEDVLKAVSTEELIKLLKERGAAV